MKFLLLALILVAAWSTAFTSRVVCYYWNFTRYKYKFLVENIDPTLCTHLVYSFYAIDENSQLISRDAWNDLGDEWTQGGLAKFLKLKNKNPSVKLLLGVGGFNEGPLGFINMVQSPEKRKAFLQSCRQFLLTYKFDGIEIDWVYSDSWGGSEAAKRGYSELVREIKQEFEKNRYVLGVATSSVQLIVENSYDIATLSKYVDYIQVMTYDYEDWGKKTIHVASLYGKNDLNVNATISSYIKDFGAIPEKLNLGVVSYGRSYTLKTKGCEDFAADTIKRGLVDPIAYWKFCLEDKKGLWKKLRNDEAKVPYAVAGDQWVGYEDVASLLEKVKYAKSKKLGGISFWNLALDDFLGSCDTGKFPLLTAVSKEMLK